MSEDLVREMILAIGDDPDREGLKETPKRVVKSWAELYSGYNADAAEYCKVFSATYDQVVVFKDIDYFSMCEHHMLPFFGKVYIAYLPATNGKQGAKVIGASKMARIVNVFARRLQIQEQMTQQVAEAIQEMIHPRGLAVIVDGMHLCMMARGVSQQHATMRTSAMWGLYREDHRAQAEALRLMGF